jgi:hypothetical protein
MLFKIILKFWPALIPILLYLIYFVVKIMIRKFKKPNFSDEKIIEGEKIINNDFKKNQNYKIFDFNNKKFLLTLYLTLIIVILCMIILAFKI